MAEVAPRRDLPEIQEVRDPEVRRALRAMYHELAGSVQRHQIEIEAMLQLILEKHVASMSEYRLHLSRLQQGLSQRGERIHEQLSSGLRGAGTGNAHRDNAPTPPPRPMDLEDEHGRYRLDG
jgi:hypothetical protein